MNTSKMQEVEYGKYTEAEAKQMWESLVQSKQKRDWKGPRGTLRFRVQIGDYESSLSELASSDEWEAAETSKKKPTEQSLRDAASNLCMREKDSVFLPGDSGDDEGEGAQAQAGHYRQKLEEGRAGIDVKAFAADAITPNKGKKRKADADAEVDSICSSAEADDGDGGDGPSDGVPRPSRRKKEKKKPAADDPEEEFDYGIAGPKAARGMATHIENCGLT